MDWKQILLNDYPGRWSGRYIKFIERFSLTQENQNQNTNKHHILPREKYKEYQSFSKHPWNKSILSLHAHYIAHWMLAKIMQGGQWTAFNQLSHDKNGNRIGGRLYAESRKYLKDYLKKIKTGLKSYTNGTKNIMLQPEDKIPNGFYLGKTFCDGYTAGPKGKIALHFQLENKVIVFVDKHLLYDYLEQGWIVGSGNFVKKPGKNYWYNNGTKNWRGELGKQPPGYKRGRLKKGKFQGPTTHNKGLIMITNGTERKYIDKNEEIPEGYIKGRKWN